MRHTPLVTFTLLLAASSAHAETFSVGPGRTYTTLGAVASLVDPGDVVEVDGDATYPSVRFTRAGAAGNPIIVRGLRVNGRRPVLSGGTNTIEIAGDHYVLEGFEVTGASFRCVYHHAHDVIMRDLVVHDCAAHGLLGADQDSGSLLLEHSEFYRSGGGTQDHQIYMATDEVAHPGAVFRMQHCYVHDANGGNSVKSRAQRNEIYYNWIEGAVYHELELIGPDPDGAPGGWSEGLAREDSDVVGNVLRKTGTFAVVRFGGDATGQSNGRYRFVSNTVVTQPGGSAIFRLFDGLESVEMHDNVFTVASAGAMNLLREVEAEWTGGRVVGGSNNWVITGALNVPPEWTGTVTGTSPGFVSLGSYDLHPEPGSAIENAGTSSFSSPPGHTFPSPLALPAFEPPMRALEAPGTAAPRTINGTIDIGAYESGGSGGSGAGGATGSGGASSGGASSGGASSGGASSGGASSGGASSGGAPGAGGALAAGGATAAGGASAMGGATAVDAGIEAGMDAGDAGLTADASASGGAISLDGGAGGSVGLGGRPGGGSPPIGGALSGAGGRTGTGGATGYGGTGVDGGAGDGASAGDDGGCGCRVGGGERSDAGAFALLLLGWAAGARRRFRTRTTR